MSILPGQIRGGRRGHSPALLAGLWVVLLVLLCQAQGVVAAEVMPAAPTQYVNDYAGVMTRTVVTQLNDQLADFERQTSNQIVVVLYPHLQTDSDVAEYTTRLFHSWKVGQKGKDSGAVLFVFVQEHKMQIITGYGLEGALPDITCKQIIDHEIAPRFKAGDYDGGVRNGINAMMAATKGEYKGTGRTVHEGEATGDSTGGSVVFWVVVIAFILLTIFSRRRGYGGWGGGFSGITFGGGGFGGGGGWSGGGGGSSGGFSGGGGDTGGGGAGGSW